MKEVETHICSDGVEGRQLMFGLLSNQFTSCVSYLSSRRLHPFSNRFKSVLESPQMT